MITQGRKFDSQQTLIAAGVAVIILLLVTGAYIASRNGQDEEGDTTPREQAVELYRDNKFDEALVKVDESIAEDGQNAEHYNFKANILRDKGDVAGATENYNKAIELNPRVTAPYVNAANMYMNQGDKAAAKAIAEKGLEVFPGQKSLTDVLAQIGE